MGNYYDNRRHFDTLSAADKARARNFVPQDLLWYFGITKENT